MSISDQVKKIPGRTSSAQYELVFQAPLPALGFSTYYFESKSSLADNKSKEKSKIDQTHNEACVLQNQVCRSQLQRFFDLYCSIFVWNLINKEI